MYVYNGAAQGKHVAMNICKETQSQKTSSCKIMAASLPEMDDIFDDEVEENEIARKDWNRTENDVKKTGYRLGLFAGQEETLQQGFNAGYAEVVRMGFAVGQLQGRISATLSMLERAACKEEGGGEGGGVRPQLEELMTACSHLHQSILNQEPPHTSASSPDCSSSCSVSPMHSELSNSNCGKGPETENGLGEVTHLFRAMEMRDCLSVMNLSFDQHLLELGQRYGVLLQQLH